MRIPQHEWRSCCPRDVLQCGYIMRPPTCRVCITQQELHSEQISFQPSIYTRFFALNVTFNFIIDGCLARDPQTPVKMSQNQLWGCDSNDFHQTLHVDSQSILCIFCANSSNAGNGWKLFEWHNSSINIMEYINWEKMNSRLLPGCVWAVNILSCI